MLDAPQTRPPPPSPPPLEPEELSAELRQARDPDLARRRAAVALSLGAAGTMALIALYQSGLIRHLPEPPLPHLDADAVDASAQAFGKLAVGDGFLGLGSYAATATLAAMGPADRAERMPLVPLALAVKALADAAQAGKLSWDQWAKHRAFCTWCLLAAGATFATLPLTLPEARRAWQTVRELGWGEALRRTVRGLA
ncbi:MAG TPA: vitamin K epoxide reductase family protein [Thermoanaerobaculia bacterium]|nr:vitamin K epoxide reductase family protein [Thermoanaerobaculia bacterium]